MIQPDLVSAKIDTDMVLVEADISKRRYCGVSGGGKSPG